MYYTFPGSGGGTSTTTNQMLDYGTGRIYFDSDASTGLPVLGGGTAIIYIQREDGEWSPWQEYTNLADMESNPMVLDFGPAPTNVYVKLTGATAADLYVEVVPGKTW